MTNRAKRPRWESAGWGVFLGLFALLAVPCLYAAHQLRAPDSPPLAAYLGGVIVAALAAGIVTVIVNSILQSRAARFDDTDEDANANS